MPGQEIFVIPFMVVVFPGKGKTPLSRPVVAQAPALKLQVRVYSYFLEYVVKSSAVQPDDSVHTHNVSPHLFLPVILAPKVYGLVSGGVSDIVHALELHFLEFILVPWTVFAVYVHEAAMEEKYF